MVNMTEIKSTQIETIEEPTKEEVLEKLQDTYSDIKRILKVYLDLKEEYYSLISLWIIGTYFHQNFSSFPYLFFNAMRGSGKSRLLRLVCKLSKEGNVMASPTEAVLFRTTGTLGIDEFERVANKDKSSIRELLNGAYKKGIKIARMKKVKSLAGEEMKVEEFEVYRPVIMANIWGMDEVLGDRCVTLILEKSDNPEKTRLTEDFEENNYIEEIKKSLVKCSLCNVVSPKNINKMWNNYISNEYKTTYTTHTSYNTLTTLTTSEQHLKLFKKIGDSKIQGRNLELFLPLFFIAEYINEKVLKEVIGIALDITSEKKHEEEIESIDVMIFDFISKQEEGLEYISMKNLTNMFREFADEPGEWLNSKFFGRALNRLNLVVDKRRNDKGVNVLLNVPKAKEKIKMFRKE